MMCCFINDITIIELFVNDVCSVENLVHLKFN